MLKLDKTVVIEDFWNHSPESVAQLRSLLSRGAHASEDPHRRHFYEVEDGSRVFYIHLSPNGNIWLLAMWSRTAPDLLLCARSATLTAV